MRGFGRSERLGLLTGGLAALLILPVATVYAAGKSDVEICGGGTATNVVQEKFTINHGKDIWIEFPALLQMPELEGVADPMRIVVFQPGYQLNTVAVGLGAMPDAGNVVCVIQPNRVPLLMINVSFQGSRFEP
jgi:hypothetical protein